MSTVFDLFESRPWLLARAELEPDAPALITDEGTVSFGELAISSERTARALRSMGVARGHRVALLMSGCRRFVEIVHALQRLGAAAVPLNVRLTPVELDEQIRWAAPTLLVHDAGTARQAALATADRAEVTIVDAEAGLDARAESGLALPADLEPEALHSVIFTSGTTASPKGVMLTNANHLASVRASAERLGFHAGDRWLAVLPLYHVGGLGIVLRSVINGFAVVLHPRFDASAANLAIHEGGVTFVSVVATMLGRMLEDAGTRRYPSSLRCVLVGGAAVPQAMVGRALALGAPVYATYGLTETASQVTASRVTASGMERGFAGRALDGVDLRVAAARPDGVGEVLVRGPQVTRGYLGHATATEERVRDGWLHTGDLGRFDADGNLYVEGRRDDLVITGGENVHPSEVEDVLTSHPDVREAGVGGLDDPDWGRRLVAWIVVHEGRDWDPAALEAWCRERLAGYKVPRELRRVSELPRTASGKLLRRRLG